MDLHCEIEHTCRQYHTRGTILLAPEGINGTICYPWLFQEEEDDDDDYDDGNDSLLNFLQSKFDRSLRIRISHVVADHPIFARLKIKIKSEIVTMHWTGKSENRDTASRGDQDNSLVCSSRGGDDTSSGGSSSSSCDCDCDPTQRVGTYVKPTEWNSFLLDPEVAVIDTRNEYEIAVGTFRNAINPHTQSFVEFPKWMQQSRLFLGNKGNQDQDDDGTLSSSAPSLSSSTPPTKIAMFCTGGIRCEKATSAALQLVPDNNVAVYHLEGGILAYLAEIPPQDSLFEGDCYVFDQRVAVTYGLQPSPTFTRSCYACRHPLSRDDTMRDDYVQGISCRYCFGRLSDKQKERHAQRQRQVDKAIQIGKLHMYDSKYTSDSNNAMTAKT